VSRLPHVSASQITTFRDCPRKWYLDKIVGLERPSTPATALGSAVHAVLEAYLRGEVDTLEGDTEAHRIAQQGFDHLPQRGGHLDVELSLEADMPLSDAVVPVKGFIDLIDHESGEIIDHKTSSNKRYTKTKKELAVNVQLILYAAAYFRRYPERERVTLTHLYYGTRGPWAKRVSVEVTREHVEREWSAIKATIEQMVEVSKADNAGDAPASYDSCDKYGGCPFRGSCLRAHCHTPKETNVTREERLALLQGGSAPQPQQPQPQQRTAPQPQQRTSAKVLYIGCFPVKGASAPPVMAMDALAPIVEEVCRGFNVPHLGVVDYGKGWAALAATLADRGWPTHVGAIYLDPISKEYEHIATVLTSLADVVIKRA
jgi:RecB family exonuclease